MHGSQMIYATKALRVNSRTIIVIADKSNLSVSSRQNRCSIRLRPFSMEAFEAWLSKNAMSSPSCLACHMRFEPSKHYLVRRRDAKSNWDRKTRTARDLRS